MLRLAVLATLAFALAEAAPSGIYGYYGPAAPHDGDEASVNRNNALRQLQVNSIANHVGTGSGTAFIDGVPGTPLGRTGHDQYSHGYGDRYYGYGGVGYGSGNGYGRFLGAYGYRGY